MAKNPGIKTIRSFQTTDGKVFMTIKDAERHQRICDFRSAWTEVEREARKIFKLPPEEDEQEMKFLEELQNATGLDYDEFSDFIHTLSEIFLFSPGGLEELCMVFKNYHSRLKK